MDPDVYVRSQFQTLKDLGLYDGPINWDGVDNDDDCLCNTQKDNDDKKRKREKEKNKSSEYLCDTQDDSPYRSPCHSPDHFNWHEKRDGYSSPHSATGSFGSQESLPTLSAGGFYRSPRQSPIHDDRFNDQELSDHDGYTSPTTEGSFRRKMFFKSGREKYDSDEPSDEDTACLIRRGHSYSSPSSSPLILRRKSKLKPAAASNSVENTDDEEDLYSPDESMFNVQLVHKMIGMEPHKIGKNGLPTNWTDAALSCFHKLVEIHSGNPEYNKICSTISNVGITVEKIERIENKVLLDKFRLEVQHMKTRRNCSDEDLNIVYLFHGTCAEKKDLAEEGLDQRLASRGHFGNGIYFSDDPRKCMEYIKRNRKRGQGCILMCQVLLGDVKVYADGRQDSTLLREPIKKGKQRYDSVKGCVSKYAEYVTYTNSRALPEYCVTVGTEIKKVKPVHATPFVKQHTAPKVSPQVRPKPQRKKAENQLPTTKPKPAAVSVAVPVSNPANNTSKSIPACQRLPPKTSNIEAKPKGQSEQLVNRSGDMPVTWEHNTEEEWQNKLAKLRSTLAEKKKKNSPKPDGSR